MKKKFHHIFQILILLLFPFVEMEAQEDIDPNWFFSYLTKETPHLTQESHDSIQNVLMSKYIQDYREYGKEKALDSLAYRTDLFINEEREKQLINMSVKEPSSVDGGEDVDFAITSVDQEILRLRQEEAMLSERLVQLKKRRQQRFRSNRYTYFIETELEKTAAATDSITKEQIKNKGLDPLLPVIFSHIKREDLTTAFHVDDASFYEKTKPLFEKTNFEKKHEEFQAKKRISNSIIHSIAVYDPDLIEYYALKEYDDKSKDISDANHSVYIMDVEKHKSEPAFEQLSKLLKPKKSGPWSSYKKLTIHFSQYYVNNWHKGGTPNSTLLSVLDYKKNYNQNDILTWDNSLNVEIGFYNTSEDTIRAFRVNNDEFDILSRFGYATGIKKLYYSCSGEFKTSLFTSYDGINSNNVATALLSPSTLTFGVGADYRYNKKTFIQLSPLAYRLIFIVDDRVDPLTEGIKDGKVANHFGYMTHSELYWKFSREINFNAKAQLFCSYPHDYIEAEIEFVGNFIINRFLSSRISFKLRTDNKKSIETGIQEQLSLGFNYEF
ncbi:MAG: DUF3078 domain-containing protein [Paludibacteraceae bacterium]|nr:DUF3078 domain-containing protein [Paludibacteraceae bacterium]